MDDVVVNSVSPHALRRCIERRLPLDALARRNDGFLAQWTDDYGVPARPARQQVQFGPRPF